MCCQPSPAQTATASARIQAALLGGILGFFGSFFVAAIVVMSIFFNRKFEVMAFPCELLLFPAIIVGGAALGAFIGSRLPLRKPLLRKSPDKKYERRVGCAALFGLFGGFLGGAATVVSHPKHCWRRPDLTAVERAPRLAGIGGVAAGRGIDDVVIVRIDDEVGRITARGGPGLASIVGHEDVAGVRVGVGDEDLVRVLSRRGDRLDFGACGKAGSGGAHVMPPSVERSSAPVGVPVLPF